MLLQGHCCLHKEAKIIIISVPGLIYFSVLSHYLTAFLVSVPIWNPLCWSCLCALDWNPAAIPWLTWNSGNVVWKERVKRDEQDWDDRTFTPVRFSVSFIHVLRQRCQWCIFLAHLSNKELDEIFDEVVKYERGWPRADIQVIGSEVRPPVFNPVLLCETLSSQLPSLNLFYMLFLIWGW